VPSHFFLPPGGAQGDRFHLTGSEASHITRVLRHKVGDSLLFFDGKGARLQGTITEVLEDGSVKGTLKDAGATPERRLKLHLYPALIKGNRWDWLLEKAVELGVHSINPVITKRTVARPEGKPERWERLVTAAAKQCGRATLPAVAEPRPLLEAAKAAPGLKLVAWEDAPDAMVPELAEVGEVSLFVGPEGGFDKEEVDSLQAVRFGLGPTILRAETAVLAAIVVVNHSAGKN
jgi:16S rRNA (uracil1498-N3)-methyltransferase